METQNQWWYEIKREQYGPVSEQEIKDLFLTSMLNKDSLVWKDGLANWVPLHTTDLTKTKPSEISTKAPDKNEEAKWYNNSKKLTLSMLFWPAFIYGMYKTSLVKRRTKQIVAGVAILIFILGSIAGDKGGGSSDSGAVRQSPWNNSVDCVEYYLKHKYLNDPDSYEGVKWGKVTKNSNGTYEVIHSFRARNGFGGMVQQTLIFTIASDGWTVINVQG